VCRRYCLRDIFTARRYFPYKLYEYSIWSIRLYLDNQLRFVITERAESDDAELVLQ
jgi:hypothetical protein